MADKFSLGSVKRFGVRYGRTNRFKRAQIEFEQKKRQKCPFCLKVTARRKALGIYNCSTCGSVFAEDAYAVGLTKRVSAAVETVVAEVKNG